MTPNYEIIGIAFRDTPESGEKFLCERRLPKVGQYSGELTQTKLVHRVRQTDLGILLAILIGRHLGAEPTTANSEITTQGSSLAQAYFTGTWPEEDARDREALDKTRSNPGLVWFEPFRNGLLLALLANRLDVVRSLADWTESWLVPEARAVPIEPLLGKWIVALVSDFRSTLARQRGTGG